MKHIKRYKIHSSNMPDFRQILWILSNKFLIRESLFQTFCSKMSFKSDQHAATRVKLRSCPYGGKSFEMLDLFWRITWWYRTFQLWLWSLFLFVKDQNIDKHYSFININFYPLISAAHFASRESHSVPSDACHSIRKKDSTLLIWCLTELISNDSGKFRFSFVIFTRGEYIALIGRRVGSRCDGARWNSMDPGRFWAQVTCASPTLSQPPIHKRGNKRFFRRQ